MSTQTINTSSPLYDIGHAERLQLLLLWIVRLALVCTPIEALLGWALHIPLLFVIAGASFFFFICASVALYLIGRGSVLAGALVVAVTLVVVAFAIVWLIPIMLAGMSLLPMIAAALLFSYVPPRVARGLSIVALLLSAALVLVGQRGSTIVDANQQMLNTGLVMLGVIAAAVVIMQLLWQFTARLVVVIDEVRVANTDLQRSRDGLELQVATRTEDLQQALRDVERRAEAQAKLLAENTQQRATILEMSTPILPVSDTTIVVPLIGALDAGRLNDIQEQTLNAVSGSRVRYVLFDITGVPMMDTHVAGGLLNTVQALALLGAESVLVGVRPEVAQAVVSLGLDLRGVTTHRSLQEGIAHTLGHR